MPLILTPQVPMPASKEGVSTERWDSCMETLMCAEHCRTHAALQRGFYWDSLVAWSPFPSFLPSTA